MRFSFAIIMVFLLTIILMDNSSALRLNEIEANPEGTDSGNEWIELYSQESVSLDGHFLENGDGGIYNLSGSFSGYFVVTFPGQWIDNTNETIYLKSSGNIIDEIDQFADNKVEKTYSFCDDEWEFISETKNGENSCANNEEPQTNNNESGQTEIEEPAVAENKTKINKIAIVPSTEKIIQQTKISLNKNNNNKPTAEITKTYKTRMNVIYFFMGFCVLLVVLISLRKL